MCKLHKYQLFNLQVESELKLNLLDEINDNGRPADLYIQLGKAPRVKEEVLYEDAYSQLTKDEYYLSVEDVANYYVAKGHYICIEPKEDLENGNITLFLLGSILGIVLAQREAIILHSSSVVVNQKAILFCGNCGAGKSTTATAFRLKGYPLLSDDINLLELESPHKVIAYRGFPQQKLCEDAMLKLGVNPTTYEKVGYAKGKYITNALTCYPEKTVPIKAIYELHPCDVTSVQIQEIKGRDKLIGLIKNLFRLQVRYYTGTSPEYMKRLVQITEDVSYFKVHRPQESFCINELMEKILIQNKE